MDDVKFPHFKMIVTAICAAVAQWAESLKHLTLADWASIIAITYGLMQTGLLLPKYWRGAKSFIKWLRGLFR